MKERRVLTAEAELVHHGKCCPKRQWRHQRRCWESTACSFGSSNPFRNLSIFGLFIVCLTFKVAYSVVIPGTTQTDNGYDTEMGIDAICWKSQSNPENGLELPNPLIEDFMVDVSGVSLLRNCPPGNNISGVAPPELVHHGERLRSTIEYNYTVFLDINMTSLGAQNGFFSDKGSGFIAVQILNCLVGTSGFCSPFIHEEANARLKAAAEEVQAADSNAPVSNNSGTPPGELHGGSHSHSGYYYKNLPTSEGPIFQNVSVTVPFTMQVPGIYFSVVSAQLYFYATGDDSNEEPQLWRYDMANALFGDQRLLNFQEPAVILDVPRRVMNFSYCLIAISSCVILFLLVQTIKHRKHQVIKLSQGSFLIVFLSFCLIATVSCFLLEPRNDAFCNSHFLVSGISLQVIYAITLGRLWRVNALVSPMLMKSIASDHKVWPCTEWVEKLLRRCSITKAEKSLRKLRTQIHDSRLWLVIFLLVVPQVIIQITAVVYQPLRRSVDLNENESKGRAVCMVNGDTSMTDGIIFYGFVIFFLLIASLLLFALKTRNLPSLFNESRTIFDSTLISFVMLAVGMAVILVSRDPTTSPAIAYLVSVFIILSMTVNMSLRIILPKLQRVWKGERVIVSKLVMDHTRKIRESKVSSASGGGRASSAYCNFDGTSSVHAQKTTAHDPFSITSSDADREQAQGEQRGLNDSTEDASESCMEPASTLEIGAPTHTNMHSRKEAPGRRTVSLLEAKETMPSQRGILIDSDNEPSRRLTITMLDVQTQLNRVTRKIMSGDAIARDEWEETRRLASKFGNIFTNEVTFAWEASSQVASSGETILGQHLSGGGTRQQEQVLTAVIDEVDEEMDVDETDVDSSERMRDNYLDV